MEETTVVACGVCLDTYAIAMTTHKAFERHVKSVH